jgi:hypothetical protein
MKDNNIYYLFSKDVEEKNNDDSYQQISWNACYFRRSHIMYISLIAICVLCLFVASDILILQPKIELLFASSSSSEGEDEEEENEEENSNIETPLRASDDSDTSDATADSFLSYNNSEYGIRVNYPSGWSYQEVQTPTDATIIPILRMFPPISDDPNAVSFLEIGIEELQSPFSIDEYSRSIINGYRESRQNFDLVSSNTDNTLSGLPAYEIVFTDSANGTDRQLMEIGALDSVNSRVYYLLFNTEESRYDLFVPALERMIDSFQLSYVDDSMINETTVPSSIPPPSSAVRDSIPQNYTDISSTLSSTAAIESDHDILLYENFSYGISVLYPARWNQFQPISDPESRTTFITQFEPIDANGTAIFAVARDTFSLNETLDTYLAETVQSYRGNTLNFTLISTAISPDTATPSR